MDVAVDGYVVILIAVVDVVYHVVHERLACLEHREEGLLGAEPHRQVQQTDAAAAAAPADATTVEVGGVIRR